MTMFDEAFPYVSRVLPLETGTMIFELSADVRPAVGWQALAWMSSKLMVPICGLGPEFPVIQYVNQHTTKCQAEIIS